MNPLDVTISNRIFVVFQSGLCGEFIISMLTGMRNPDAFDYLDVTHAGSCHVNRRNEPEIKCRDRKLLEEQLHETQFPTWLIKAHININDSDLVLKRYPDSKVVVMTQDLPDSYRGFTNFIHKAVLAEWENYGREAYNEASGLDPIKEKRDIKRAGIDNLYIRFKDPDHFPIEVHGKMARYIGRYITFPIDVLYNDRTGTFKMLEHISGLEMNPRAEKFYDTYIANQPSKEFILRWWNSLK